MDEKRNFKADCFRLFGSGFKPCNFPLSGRKDTIRRYYRQWLAGGGQFQELESPPVKSPISGDFNPQDAEPTTPLAVSIPSSAKASAALIELENNLAIAGRANMSNMLKFQTDIWNTKRGEFNPLPTEILGELMESYVDMLLANNIAWLVTELGNNSPDLIDSYDKLRNKIADRLQRIMPDVRNSLSNDPGSVKPGVSPVYNS